MNLILAGLSAQSVADLVMGFSGVTGIVFLIVILFFGYYGTSSLLRLKKEQALFPNRLMYPNYCPHDECIDPEGYIRFIFPRLAVLSASMLLSGLTLLLSYFIPGIRSLGLSLGLYVVPLAVYLYYSASLKKAAKIYW